MSIEKQLADALRATIATLEAIAKQPRGLDPDQVQGHANIARRTLAEYDEWPERMATDYRVTTEWDAFDADSPRAAAVEVWQRIRESAGPVFTVRCSDGRVLDVDLSDETDEGAQA